ncbi:MAG TPA: PilN domain-containing protein [Solirubrobacteraceae bacterium]|jgi:Tfp pilus assembly protein PilN|nr:PilN domain-containing protein [Solirubrobacteraceae bacterium]
MRAVNLIPGEQGRQSASLAGRSGGAALILLGLIVGVAVLAFFYGKADRQIARQTGEVARIEAQTNAVRARANQLTPYTSFVSMAEQRTKTVAQLVQARFDWSHMLRELGRVLPSGAALQSLQGTVGAAGGTSVSATTRSGSTPTSSTPPGSTPTLALTGCATSQSVVAQILQRLKLIDGAQEVHLQSSTKSAASAGGSSSSGACGDGRATFSTSVVFAALPSSPVPNVTPPTTPVSGTGTPAKAEQVSTRSKGGSR